ncbi:MAG: hypothetical protein U9R40_06475 [Synergistota bacterium]|nr:hypothetical protein [Synergistota bacterium]
MGQSQTMNTDEIVGECGHICAMLVESVARTAQVAGSATPQLQELFDQWVSLLGREILREEGATGDIDIAERARAIGISPSSLLHLLLSLERKGEIEISRVSFTATGSGNREVCTCMKEGDSNHDGD